MKSIIDQLRQLGSGFYQLTVINLTNSIGDVTQRVTLHSASDDLILESAALSRSRYRELNLQADQL